MTNTVNRNKSKPIYILMRQHGLGSDFLGVFSSEKLAKEWAKAEKRSDYSYIFKDYMDDPIFREGI